MEKQMRTEISNNKASSSTTVLDVTSYSYKSHTKYHKITKNSISQRPAWKQNTIKPKE
ncbi:MAG: hypothetical protein ACK4IX_00075 [Candidatus Sericytochromatia bacterium]